ncbi:MAG: dephospho-CoA kinase [Thiobacillus sp.]|nr:dephospho-CoA kinase [Thiobacillus sp.]
MLVIGLTGGIGSGKSTVADLFARRGAAVIDTDVIARQLVAPGMPALAEIRAAFSDSVMDAEGQLDRAGLRRLVFADEVARRRLEAILHPRIRVEVKQALAHVDAPYAVIAVPLLVETQAYRDLLDRVLVVDCPEPLQIARVIARNGLSADEVRAIIDAQVSRATRLAAADDVIENTVSVETLQSAVADLHHRYLNLGRAGSP